MTDEEFSEAIDEMKTQIALRRSRNRAVCETLMEKTHFLRRKWVLEQNPGKQELFFKFLLLKEVSYVRLLLR